MIMELEKFRNKLCIFEGADQTGKTTVAKLLVEKLNDNGIPALFTYQPGDPAYGVTAALFRSLCKDKRWNLHPLSNMYAFFLDKVEQVTKVVQPALAEGKAVISDRWYFSTTAYQFYGKQIIDKYQLTQDVADWLNYTSELGRSPDIVFYFPEKIEKPKGIRISDSGSADLFENENEKFKQRIKAAYERMEADPKLKFKRIKPANSAKDTLSNLLTINF